jgi:hypothetical protein
MRPLDVSGRLELPGTAYQSGLLALIEDDIMVFRTAAQKLLAGRARARILQRKRVGRELRRARNVGNVERHIADFAIAKWDWHSNSSAREVRVGRSAIENISLPARKRPYEQQQARAETRPVTKSISFDKYVNI